MKLCAPEEMIWMKAYIMERERFDGADIAHILRYCTAELDWSHLVRRFGSDCRVLLSHLILFGYIYPEERTLIPGAVMEELIARLQNEAKTPGPERLCRGTLLSRQQYLVDVQDWGFRDARLEEHVQMKCESHRGLDRRNREARLIAVIGGACAVLSALALTMERFPDLLATELLPQRRAWFWLL